MQLISKTRRRSRTARAVRRVRETVPTKAAAAGLAGAGAAVALLRTRRGTSGGGPQVHTNPREGHPAGTGERSDRDIGGPTAADGASTGDATGGATGTPPDSGFESHS